MTRCSVDKKLHHNEELKNKLNRIEGQGNK